MTPKLIISSIVGVAAIGGSAAGIYHFSKDKTIKDSLIRKGTELINSEDEYGATFLKWKNNEAFKTTIGNIETTTNFQQGSLALKTWCENNLKLELTNKETKDKLPKVEDYCSKQTLDIKARFDKAEKKLVADGGWAKKYGTVKGKGPSHETLSEELNIKNLGTDNGDAKAGAALQAWCEKSIKIKLLDDKEEKTWQKVEARCAQ